jgi:transcriptional pleiotropic regulator of transition state genes
MSGIVRTVDNMGRVVIPKEIRAQLGIENNVDSLEIFLEGDKIILKKFRPTCFFCDQIAETVEYNGYLVCKNCIEKLNSMKDTAD